MGLPEGLDGLYRDSLKRVLELGNGQWKSDYAPLVGVLAVAEEPLTLAQIQAFTGQDEIEVWQHLVDMEQFVMSVAQAQHSAEPQYRLYHQSFADFLDRQVLELTPPSNPYYLPARACHRRLAASCEAGSGGLATIWQKTTSRIEQGRRSYACKHYVRHLAEAEEWDRLWDVLNDASYGRAKLQYDPSMRAYAHDLDVGRQAAARTEIDLSDGFALLPNLWRYTLLRCTLASQAMSYPPELFEALVLLKRSPEALGFAELLTDPAKKVETLTRIAAHLRHMEQTQSGTGDCGPGHRGD